jgi:hypothetical protein
MEGGLKALNIGREWKGDDGLGLKMSFVDHVWSLEAEF